MNEIVSMVNKCFIFLLLLNLALSKNPDDQLVYEMDDRLIDYATMGKWIIMFYAPWCGHCKKLEPVFEEVGRYYQGRMLTVAKIDATRFVKAASHFEIKAYPTIKFIYGKVNVNFNGERRKEDVIEFVERADTIPRVQKILHQLDFEHHKHLIPLFFLLVVKPEDETHPLKEEYYAMAEKHFLDAYFYSALPDYISKTATVFVTPKVGVIREHELIYYDKNNFTSMEQFIKLEQFPIFPEITLTNFYNLMETRKILMILLYNGKDTSKEKQIRKIKQNFKIYSKVNKNAYRDLFQFGYTENHELLSGIAIWSLNSPVLFILNTSDHTYALVDLIDSSNKVIDLDLRLVIRDVRERRLDFYGGHSMFRSIRRPLWEIYRAIIEMFIEAPFISLLIFGFPFGVISIVFYFLCCIDSTETDLDHEENLSDSDEDDQQYLLDEASKIHERIKATGENTETSDPKPDILKIQKPSKKTQ